MKSSYMISTIGRMPIIAAPMPRPVMAISEIGVLRIRSGPNSSSMPTLTFCEPPCSPMSSPMRKTSGSWRIACDITSRTASRYDNLGIHVVPELLGRRVGAAAGELDGVERDLLRALVVRGELVVRDREALAQLVDRILRRAGLVVLLFGAVLLRVADVVRRQAVGVDEQEDRAVAGAGELGRLLRRLVDGLHVLAVGLDRVHAEGDGAVREILYRAVLPVRRRLGPLVVLDAE